MLVSCLAFSKRANLDEVVQHKGISHSREPAGKLVGHLYLHGNAHRDTAQHSERRKTH